MSVLVETSVGDFVCDLYLSHAPVACCNFLKLCKVRAYDGNLFFRVVKGFLAQTGDPSGTGRGGAASSTAGTVTRPPILRDQLRLQRHGSSTTSTIRSTRLTTL